jgi:hypothetical protein
VYLNEEQPYIHYTKDRLNQRELEWLNSNATSGVQLVSASDCVNLQSHNRQLELATPDKLFRISTTGATRPTSEPPRAMDCHTEQVS